MAHIADQGSHFEAPIDVVWKYLESGQDHGQAHTTTRNQQMKPLSETSFVLSMERNVNGRWIHESNRISIFPPLGMVIEVLEGPLAGSKMINIYTPKGNRTAIDVYGEFTSTMVPPNQLEHAVLASLETAFNEDAPAIKALGAKK
ncbi:MAG: hypothetical protein ACLQD8_00565 [Thermoplasmata archaeon]